jgi:hypothetical protein
MSKVFITGLDVFDEYNAMVEEEELIKREMDYMAKTEEAMTPSRGPRKARGHPEFVDLDTMTYTHVYVYIHNDRASLSNMLERGKILDIGYWNEKYLFPVTDANKQACAVMGIELVDIDDIGFGGTE